MGVSLCTACPATGVETAETVVPIPISNIWDLAQENDIKPQALAENHGKGGHQEKRRGTRFADNEAEQILVSLDSDDLKPVAEDESPEYHKVRSTTSSASRSLNRSVSIRSRSSRLPSYIDPNHGLRSGKSVMRLAGSIMDTYEMKARLGEGSFGMVSKVRHRKTGKLYAMKSIPIANVPDPEVFQRELGIARQLKHPYIVHLRETFEDSEAYYLIMELCTGGDALDKVIASVQHIGNVTAGGLEPRQVAKYLWQMLNGIAYLHNYKFAHRDIKPENYLLASEAVNAPLKLIDFGLGRSFGRGERMTSKVGTAAYVAPEVMTSQNGYDALCDMWSIGVTTFVLTTAEQPFTGNTEKEVLEAVIDGHITYDYPVWKRHPDLKDVVERLLTKDPAKRPQAKAILETNEWLRKTGATAASQGCCSMQ